MIKNSEGRMMHFEEDLSYDDGVDNSLTFDQYCPNNMDTYKTYIQEAGRYPLLSADEERELAFKISNQLTDAEAARKKLTNCNLRLVISIAKRYPVHSEQDFLDHIQDGNLGLLKAVERFDYTKGFRFSTYATHWIRQSITLGISDKDKTIRVPVKIAGRINKIKKTEQKLAGELYRQPTIKEIAAEMCLSPKKVTECLQLINNTVSLEEPIWEDSDYTYESYLKDNDTVNPESKILNESFTYSLREMISTLPEQEEKVIRLRYGFDDEPKTLEETGYLLKLTRERVRQIENNALRNLRQKTLSRRLICAY